MKDRRPRRLLVWTTGCGILVALGAAAGWAGAEVLTPPREVLDAAEYTFVEVVDGEVGASITLNTVARWEQTPAGTNRASGVVTGVRVAAGDLVNPGSVLFDVDLRPVVIAEGAVPAFRALAQGSEGADVTQLQLVLTELGYYDGEPDGGFGPRTERAVREWQESLGIGAPDGVVMPGDIVFVPSLPVRVALDQNQVFRGATLSGGEAIVAVLGEQPSFHIPATVQQAAMMPIGTRVEIAVEDTVWVAAVAEQLPAGDRPDQVDVRLEAEDGGSLCTDQCALVPIEGEALLTSRIITQPSVAGLVVPSAVLLSSPDGSVSVVDDAGRSHPVDVVASSQGMSVLDGIQVGMRLRVPASGEGAG